MIDQHQQYSEFIQQTGMHAALCPGGSLAMAATELLSSMDEDTCYDVAPLQEALENWELAKPVADIHAMFEKWYTAQFSRRGGVTAKDIPPEFFDRNEDGEYQYYFVRNYWPAFEAMVSLSHTNLSADMRRDLEELRQQVASLRGQPSEAQVDDVESGDKPKPRYRLLEDGDKILPSDYWLLADTETWVNVGDKANSWIGATFNGSFHHPCRRPLMDEAEAVDQA